MTFQHLGKLCWYDWCWALEYWMGLSYGLRTTLGHFTWVVTGWKPCSKVIYIYIYIPIVSFVLRFCCWETELALVTVGIARRRPFVDARNQPLWHIYVPHPPLRWDVWFCFVYVVKVDGFRYTYRPCVRNGSRQLFNVCGALLRLQFSPMPFLMSCNLSLHCASWFVL